MEQLSSHYSALLGLSAPWEVESVKLQMESQRVEILVEHAKGPGRCPECGDECALYDRREERSWRHLDTMQFETIIRCRVPRCECPQHGVQSVQVPWAGKHSRFTLMFECFAVAVLQACSNVEGARRLLRLNWRQVDAIRTRAVERGLQRRNREAIANLGIDEKSFGKWHRYVSILSDLDRSRVWEVSEGRSEESAQQLMDSLSCAQRESVEAVALDMWPAYMNARRKNLPLAFDVHDRFHVSKHLGEAIDSVRRAENKRLCQDGDESLKGTRWLWLKRTRSVAEEQAFAALEKDHLEVARAWQLRELFDRFWSFRDPEHAGAFFLGWFSRAIESGLAPVTRVARMLKAHLEGLLGYCFHPISNAASEGFNSKIQTIKAAARGFRFFEKYRIAILFYCGKLDLNPL